jgi:cytochrome c oxidase cbb3-type subunit I
MTSDQTNAPLDRATPEDLRERAAIDRSVRLPVLFFLTSGLVWLVLSSVLGLLASVRLHSPGLFDWDWLTWFNWGRLQPAFLNSLVYGWAFQAAIAIGLWIMARLCRIPLKNPLTLVVAGHVWNLGVVVGMFTILCGAQGPGELLEFGRTAWLMLFAAYAVIVVWMVLMYVSRRPGADYVSQWYIIGACFWFPWIYLTANIFTSPKTASGLHAALTAAWYSNSVLFLFIVPMAIGTAYYLIPKVIGRPLHSYYLAVAGFWTLAIFGGWTGVQKLIGGPLPTWMTAVSSAAQVFLLIPVVCVAANHYLTARGNHGLIQVSPTLRFVFGGAVFYVGGHLVAAGLALFPGITQFTAAWDGLRFMLIYSYFTVTMFGAIYFLLPRLTGCEWLSPNMMRFHFWFTIYGGASIGIMLLLGGVFQASSINSWSRNFSGAVENTNGFHVGATLGWLMVLSATLVFFLHFILMTLRLGRRSERATLLHGPHDYDHAEVMITTEGAEA